MKLNNRSHSVLWLTMILAMSIMRPNESFSQSAQSAAEPAALPRVILSARIYPENVQDEAAYENWLQGETDRRVEEWKAQVVPSSSAALAVDAANWILARPLEPILSRRILNLAQSEDGDRAAGMAAQATQILTEARAALDRAGNSETDGLQHDTTILMRLDTLEAFARAAGAMFSSNSASADLSLVQQQCRKAAADLAIVGEDAEPPMAAACVLWQALLLEKGGHYDRMWAVLPQTLSDPGCIDCSPSLFMRLLRCRLICERPTGVDGGCTAAWTLALKLQETATAWFTHEEARQEAARSAAWVRLQVGRGWRDSLGNSARSTEMEWFKSAEERIRKEFFKSEPSTLLRLELAMPMLKPTTPSAVTPVENAVEQREPEGETEKS